MLSNELTHSKIFQYNSWQLQKYSLGMSTIWLGIKLEKKLFYSIILTCLRQMYPAESRLSGNLFTVCSVDCQ